MSKFLVILDGLEDISYEELNGKTPLASGAGDSFHFLNQYGSAGTFLTTPEGFSPDTMACVLTLLGEKSENIPKGRGWFEALSQQRPIHPEDLWFRVNFVKVNEDNNIISPCFPPAPQIHHDMIKFIRGEGFRWFTSEDGKGLISIPFGKRHLDTMITFPPHENLGTNIQKCYTKGNIVGAALQDLSSKILKAFHPYTIIPWGESSPTNLLSFFDLHQQTGSIVTGKDVVVGIGEALQMDVLYSPHFTGDIDTDLNDKLIWGIKASEHSEIVVIHVNGTDEVSHRGNALEKATFISRIDKELISPLISHVKKTQGSLLVTSDHGTLCSTGEHTSSPVSFWLYHTNLATQFHNQCIPGVQALSLL